MAVTHHKSSESKNHVWLVKNSDVYIQGRYETTTYKNQAQFSKSNKYMTAVAIGGPFLKGHTLVVRPQNSRIFWKGKEIFGSMPSMFKDELITATYDSMPHVHDSGKTVHGINVELPLDVHLLFNRYREHIGIQIMMPPRAFGQRVEGQCGNFNGDASDDTENMAYTGNEVIVKDEDDLLAFVY